MQGDVITITVMEGVAMKHLCKQDLELVEKVRTPPR